MTEFAVIILLPTLLVRLGVFICLRRRNYGRMQRFIMVLNATWNFAFALWTSIQLYLILNHPRLADCKFNNHSMLEINYIILIFLGLFPIVIFACFVLYCIGIIPYACYKRCKGQRMETNNITTRTLTRLICRT